MGTMTFLLPDPLSADAARELEKASIAGGPEGMPWPTTVQIEPGRFLVERAVTESGYLAVPWTIDGAGRLMGATLSTCRGSAFSPAASTRPREVT